MNSNYKKSILIGLAASIAILAGFFFFFDLGDLSRKTRKISGPMSKTSDPTKNSGGGNSPFESGTDGLDYGVTPKFLLKTYLEWAKYPPNSRPIDNNNHAIIKPYEIDIDAVTMVDTPQSKEPNGYRCHFQPRTWAVVGIESEIFITLECRDSKSRTIPIKIDNYAMYQYKGWEDTKTQVHSAEYNDKGRDGDVQAKDNIYTFHWRPMSKNWGEMFLEVDITYAPEGKKAHLVATFFSSPNKPAEFTNYFREVVEEGSLSIYAGISVFKAGNYTIEGNLQNEAGDYIAYAKEDVKLKSGSQEVKLVFFGKILKDLGTSGSYVLTSLRGQRDNLPFDPELFADPSPEALKIIQSAKTTEPDKEIIPFFKKDYTTLAYSPDDFSEEEWKSPEKDKRIEELKGLGEELAPRAGREE
ncbi:MAG: hypothetical protein AAF518_15615 [Spirochaetota bacterium]